MSSNEIEQSRLLPTRQVCRRYNVSGRTVARWERDPELKFPQPIVINNRKYYSEGALTTWDRKHARCEDIAA